MTTKATSPLLLLSFGACLLVTAAPAAADDCVGAGCNLSSVYVDLVDPVTGPFLMAPDGGPVSNNGVIIAVTASGCLPADVYYAPIEFRIGADTVEGDRQEVVVGSEWLPINSIYCDETDFDWGPNAHSSQSALGKIWRHEAAGKVARIVVPCFFAAGTTNRHVVDYLLGAFNRFGFPTLFGDEEPRRGNGSFAGATVGPETYRDGNGQPQTGLGRICYVRKSAAEKGDRSLVAYWPPVAAGGRRSSGQPSPRLGSTPG